MVDKEQSREIRGQIRRLLMDQWDPIGVSVIPEAADEYDSYIGKIYELIQADAPEQEIAAHLRTIEIQQMEMVDASGAPLFQPSQTRYRCILIAKSKIKVATLLGDRSVWVVSL